MARPLDLLRQTPGFAVALYAQGAGHHQGIIWRRRIEQALVPKGLCSVFGEGPAVETQQTCRFCRLVVHGARLSGKTGLLSPVSSVWQYLVCGKLDNGENGRLPGGGLY